MHMRNTAVRRSGLLLVPILLLGLVLSCGIVAGLVSNGIVTLPERTVVIGPMAISGSRTINTSCGEPWSYCNPFEPEFKGPSSYAIWVVIQTGPGVRNYQHYGIQLPLRR
jgi:hypothetical protein